jgi:hypothetical protein
MEVPMRPTTAYGNVFDFEALLHPGTLFDSPSEVLKAEALTLSEKRAILASWASDASAIASCPALRSAPGLKAPVTIDAVLEALQALDDRDLPEPPGGKPQRLKSVSRALAA